MRNGSRKRKKSWLKDIPTTVALQNGKTLKNVKPKGTDKPIYDNLYLLTQEAEQLFLPVQGHDDIGLGTTCQKVKEAGALRTIASNGITTEEFARAQNNLQKQHADYRKANAFWLSAISERVRHDSSDMLEYEKALKQVKPADVKKLARLLSKSTNTVEVIMDGI